MKYFKGDITALALVNIPLSLLAKLYMQKLGQYLRTIKFAFCLIDQNACSNNPVIMFYVAKTHNELVGCRDDLQ